MGGISFGEGVLHYMFYDDYTSSIIAFINSIIRLDKIDKHKELLNEAIQELKNRVPLLAQCYDCDERLQIKQT